MTDMKVTSEILIISQFNELSKEKKVPSDSNLNH